MLDTDEEERLPVAASLLGITTKLHRQVLSGNLGGRHRGPETLQLGIDYRGSSLVDDERDSAANVRAGDRAPDAPCSDPDGTSTRLFDVFRGTHEWKGDAQHHTLIGETPHQTWLLKIEGDTIQGTLTLADRTVVRRMT